MRELGSNIKITVNDLSVSYNDEGKAGDPVIIFIHGFPFNKSMWDRQAEALKENYRVIAYDVRGHGNSDTGTEDFSVDLFANDLLNLMDALKIDKTMLCGLSMGGYIALNAVGNYPDRFDALILSDTTCTADTPEVKEKRMKSIESIKKNGVEKFADESITNLFAPESFSTKKKEIAAVREMIVNTTEESLCKTLRAFYERKETCSKLHDINVPALILVGIEDKITPPAAAHFMNEKIKESLLSIIEHAGHLSNIENPSEFNNQLEKFVSTIYYYG
ncbi:MAG TPA: alpha/beta fold hydrolase [Ignavibacteriaceae bacterium]|nr:alpha/beta fold hydrolase [Ignavibacteriaceae bacterium]